MNMNLAPSRRAIALGVVAAPVAALALACSSSPEPQERKIPCQGDAATPANTAIGGKGEYDFTFTPPATINEVLGRLSVTFSPSTQSTKDNSGSGDNNGGLRWNWIFPAGQSVTFTENERKANVQVGDNIYVMGINNYPSASEQPQFAVACLSPDGSISKNL